MPLLPIGRRDFVAGGWSVIFLVLSTLPAGGGLVGVVSLRLCRVLVLHKDCSNCLLAGGVVGGDVQELANNTRILAPLLVRCDTSGVSTFKYNQCTLVKVKGKF